ncbi:MAG: hypothetical protein HY290_13950 [Planctomycetia bacterium]|nr:hypothetical protein [Planctomycetia bacterium]
MVRKCAYVLGIVLGVSALVLDGTASTAEACGGCRNRCRSRCNSCCAPTCCAPACCAPAPCYSSCGSCSTCYSAPSCSTCYTPGYYTAPVNVAQVPGYGAQYNYSARVVTYPSRSVTRVRLVSLR